MNMEIKVPAKAVNATLALIHEYLAEGGTGIDAAALEEMHAALAEADRIVIIAD